MASTKIANNGSARRARVAFACEACGWQAAKWVGQCGDCGAWGTLAERAGPALHTATAAVHPITAVTAQESRAVSTGLCELDRVLGGGLVAGSVALLSGDPGVGKSTLLIEVAARVARSGPVLYVSGEESTPQLRLRAERVGALADGLLVAAETNLLGVLSLLETTRAQLLVVDSIQTIVSPTVDGAPGGVTQVREAASAIVVAAKAAGVAVILVGHVTKDGSLAGPRTLEHLVDVVLAVDGDRHSRLRLVRASKNRFGPADEVGCFELTDSGVREVLDPSAMFISERPEAVSGTCVTVSLDGSRPLAAEVQALIDPTTPGSARRTTHGLDPARAAMTLAVLERRAGVGLRSGDAYLSTVGGVRITEPAADLAVLLAAASAVTDIPVPLDMVAIGEVGLAGEIRSVPGLGARLAQAARLGYRRALVPTGGLAPAGSASGKIEVLEVATVAEAISAALTASKPT